MRSLMPMRRLMAALLVGTGLVLSAGASAESVLKVVPQADLRTLDPVAVTVNLVRVHGLQVYETLFAWDSKFRPQPLMIESYETTPDRLTYAFTLRSGLTFHDGQAVEAKDVVASLGRWMKRDAMGRRLAAMTANLAVTDARRFTLTLKEPYPFVEFSLGSPSGQPPVIMREKDGLSDPFVSVAESVGSGPFRFVKEEWAPGAKVVYEKFKDYKPRTEATDGLAGARLVKVDRMEWISLPDPATAANALIRGEVDYMEYPAPDVLPLLKQSKDIVIKAVSPLNSQAYLSINNLHPPFDNMKARQALAAMVDQTEFLMAAIGDPSMFQTCRAFFTCGSPYATEVGMEPYQKPNRELARKLLAESGYKGEKVYVLSTTEIAVPKAMAMVAAEQMKSIGLNVELMLFDWGTTVTRWGKKDPPATGGWNIFVAGAAPTVAFHPLTNFYVDTVCTKTNVNGWPCDEEAVKLRDRLLRASDEGERKTALEAFHRRLAEVQPYVPVGEYKVPQAWRTSVQGVLFTPAVVYWNISKS